MLAKSKLDNLVCPINHARLKSAVEGILQNLEINYDSGRLLNPVSDIRLVISLHKQSEIHERTVIPIPHSLYNKSSDVCLIVKDIENDRDKTIEHFEEKLRNAHKSLKVIPLSSLKKDYKEFEAKRLLARSYDVFIVDEKIIHVMAKLMGKEFFTTSAAQNLIPMNVEASKLKAEFKQTINSTVWFYKGSERETRIVVGRNNSNVDHIVDNLEVCLKGVALSVLRGWNNVRRLFLKSKDTLPFPIYMNEDVSEDLEEVDPREVYHESCPADRRMTGEDLYTMSVKDMCTIITKKSAKVAASFRKSNPTKKSEEPEPSEIMEIDLDDDERLAYVSDSDEELSS